MKIALPESLKENCVIRNDCFIWQGPFGANNHPRITVDNKRILVKRHICDINKLDVETKIITVTCGDRRCINPEHWKILQVHKRPKEKPVNATNRARDNNLYRLYGITLTEWDALFNLQKRKCAICRGSNPRGKNWHTDHSHTSGKIRGILCGWCNTALGKFQENTSIIKSATTYLETALGSSSEHSRE